MKRQIVYFIFLVVAACVCCLNACTKDSRPLPVALTEKDSLDTSPYTIMYGIVKDSITFQPIENAKVVIRRGSYDPTWNFPPEIVTTYTKSDGTFYVQFIAPTIDSSHTYMDGFYPDISKNGYKFASEFEYPKNAGLPNKKSRYELWFNPLATLVIYITGVNPNVTHLDVCFYNIYSKRILCDLRNVNTVRGYPIYGNKYYSVEWKYYIGTTYYDFIDSLYVYPFVDNNFYITIN